MARPCTVCSHLKRAEIDEALLGRTSIRDVARQFEVGRNAVDRHRSHVGTLLAEAGQRRAKLEVDHGDDLLGQVKALTRDLQRALDDAKRRRRGRKRSKPR